MDMDNNGNEMEKKDVGSKIELPNRKKTISAEMSAAFEDSRKKRDTFDDNLRKAIADILYASNVVSDTRDMIAGRGNRGYVGVDYTENSVTGELILPVDKHNIHLFKDLYWDNQQYIWNIEQCIRTRRVSNLIGRYRRDAIIYASVFSFILDILDEGKNILEINRTQFEIIGGGVRYGKQTIDPDILGVVFTIKFYIGEKPIGCTCTHEETENTAEPEYYRFHGGGNKSLM
jgi:hypothetical protein